MIAAFTAGLVGVAAFCSSVISTGVKIDETVMNLRGENIGLALPENFNRISFDAVAPDENHPLYEVTNFKGLSITESDTATSSVISMSAELSRAVDFRISGDTLNVRINFMALTDSINVLRGNRYKTTISGDGKWPVSITVPRGKLRGAQAKWKSLRLRNFDRGFFKTEVADRLVLDNCRFDSLRCASGQMKELKLENSSAKFVHIRQPWQRVRMIGVNETDTIGTLKITGQWRSRRVDLEDIRVGTILWEPVEPDASLQLYLKSPATVIAK